ncbi:hypothetical protein [Mesorhizobium neociceri]|uniref:hypothetical protein n=1 Tax=Mesorhizobium neociceri TaxID=1307853 RepID=UPI001AEE95B5|nr:hypothetical protein [Mesorhizobium neociceri]
MHHPGSTEWPIWHDDPTHDQQGQGAPQRHDIALAGYLEKQQAWRASAVRRFDLSAAVDRAHVLAARAAKNAVQLIDGIGLTLSKAHSQFSKTLWGR